MSIARHATLKPRLTHLLLAGHNPLSPPATYSSNPLTRQHPSNPSLSPIPIPTWLGQVGRKQDIRHGWSLIPSASLAVGLEHSLLAYRSHAVDRVFAVGRNEVGQLGIGFASQEGTRGLVEGFEGDEVQAVAAGCQSSYLVVREGDGSGLYSMGNLARGRLAQPAYFPPKDGGEHDEPRVELLSKATRVHLPPEIQRIRQVAAGFEHFLLLAGMSGVCNPRPLRFASILILMCTSR